MTGVRTPNQLDTGKLKKSTVKRRLQFTSSKTESSESSMVCEWQVFSYTANICRSQFSSHKGLYISLVPISGDNDIDGGGSITSSNENNKRDKVIDSAATNESYINVQRDCEIEGMHLLPQVVFPVENTTENIAVEKRLITCTKERDKALWDTLHCRTLVEKFETDIKELKTNMHHRVSTVRDFWRNSVLEGRSRSGAILK